MNRRSPQTPSQLPYHTPRGILVNAIFRICLVSFWSHTSSRLPSKHWATLLPPTIHYSHNLWIHALCPPLTDMRMFFPSPPFILLFSLTRFFSPQTHHYHPRNTITPRDLLYLPAKHHKPLFMLLPSPPFLRITTQQLISQPS